MCMASQGVSAETLAHAARVLRDKGRLRGIMRLRASLRVTRGGQRCRSASHVDGVHPHGTDNDLDARLAGLIVNPQIRAVLRADFAGEGVVII